MRYIIDRFEEGCAVCETEGRNHISISLDRLPGDIREGDVIVSSGETYEIDRKETQDCRKRIREKMRKLFE